MIDMKYDDQFTIKVYDLGGHERIRDIWTNYYAEVHGIMYVVDLSNEERLEENYETLKKLQQHQGTSRKPFLIVLNKRKPTELDDFDFTMNANLNAIGLQYEQMIFVTHVNEYKGEVVFYIIIVFAIPIKFQYIGTIEFQLDKAKYPPPPVSKRPRRSANPLLTQFCVFIDKIIEHYVYLSEGVRSAEIALKTRQQSERDERRLRLMRQEEDIRSNEVAQLEGRYTSHNGNVRCETVMELATQMPHGETQTTTPVELESRQKTMKCSPSPKLDNHSPVESLTWSPSPNHLSTPNPPIAKPLPPPRRTWTKVTPLQDAQQSLPVLHDVDIFTTKQSSVDTPYDLGQEKHKARMRRIQEGFRKRVHNAQL
ncbi:hypothetical protein DICVIV_10360 [Dictyocaulus viviparus]|uniref:ADP-ribosylation factor family protein n=1 Tax=Dictyocaulus viviparus TaxID=29172 RepID=A0A0D8XG76_DICVI|nr:hypothetical protein DICVIV_10360 [Dictyocaulus viviparus]